MAIGINHYIFISVVTFGAGLFVLLTAKESIRVLIGLSMLFSASIINIAAFSGFWNFNPEGQIIIFIISAICLLNISVGIILFIGHYKAFHTNLFEEAATDE